MYHAKLIRIDEELKILHVKLKIIHQQLQKIDESLIRIDEVFDFNLVKCLFFYKERIFKVKIILLFQLF